MDTNEEQTKKLIANESSTNKTFFDNVENSQIEEKLLSSVKTLLTKAFEEQSKILSIKRI